MVPEIGQKVFEPDGTEWEIYLTEVMVPCVRLVRFDGTQNLYHDVPASEFGVIK